ERHWRSLTPSHALTVRRRIAYRHGRGIIFYNLIPKGALPPLATPLRAALSVGAARRQLSQRESRAGPLPSRLARARAGQENPSASSGILERVSCSFVVPTPVSPAGKAWWCPPPCLAYRLGSCAPVGRVQDRPEWQRRPVRDRA